MLRNKKEEHLKFVRRRMKEIDALHDKIIEETVTIELETPIFDGYFISNVPSKLCTQIGLAEAINASTEIIRFTDKPFTFSNLRNKLWSEKKKVHFNKKEYIKGSCGFVPLYYYNYKNLSPDAKKWFEERCYESKWGVKTSRFYITRVPYGAYEEKATKAYITEVHQEPHHLKRLLDDLEKSISYSDECIYYRKRYSKDLDIREWKVSKKLAIEKMLNKELLDKELFIL